ncbi:MAG: hypothetical protein WD002_14100 [Pseudomonadales bacterium]
MSNDAYDSRQLVFASFLFGLISLLIIVDLFIDLREGVSPSHIIIELGVLVAAAAGIALLWHKWREATLDLGDAKVAAERWRKESETLLKGLSQAIDRQFAEWRLAPAEAQVALLLLKGLSLKEIAGVRSSSERTIREQARAVYRKAGLSGRSALSAFFLEDLLLPISKDAEDRSAATQSNH